MAYQSWLSFRLHRKLLKIELCMLKYLNKALILLSFYALSTASLGQAYKTDQIEVELVSESKTVVPGETLWLAIRLDPIEHWHTCLLYTSPSPRD